MATTVIALIIGAAAYSMARFRTGGKHLAFWFLSQRLLLPIAVIIPVFLLYSRYSEAWFGSSSTRRPASCLYTVFALPFTVWMMYVYFRQMPSARGGRLVDGCSRVQAIWKIACPAAARRTVSAAAFAFIFSWTEFLFAQVLARDNAITLPVALAGIITGFQGNQYGEASASRWCPSCQRSSSGSSCSGISFADSLSGPSRDRRAALRRRGWRGPRSTSAPASASSGQSPSGRRWSPVGPALSAATSCALLDTGRRVVVLDVRDFIPEARFTIGEDADDMPVELASIGDQARVLDVFRVHRPDEVVHAGMILDPAYLATNRTTAFQVNVGGVMNLVEAMIAFGVSRMVNFSSIGVLPRVMYEPIDANHPILLADAGPGTDFYGSTKVAAEAMLFAYHQALGLDFRTIRPSAVYGLGMNQYVGPIKAMVENAVRGEPAHFEFGGAHPRAYTHARDIAGLVVAMLDAPDDADRIFYGSTGGAMVTTTEVAQIVRELVGDVEIGEELSEAEKPVVALRAELSIENARAQLGWEPEYASIRTGSPSTSSTIGRTSTPPDDVRRRRPAGRRDRA